eukprot:Skav209471  [mRNA]  locus=scaffold3498:263640:266521:+ [translate_table: standard]
MPNHPIRSQRVAWKGPVESVSVEFSQENIADVPPQQVHLPKLDVMVVSQEQAPPPTALDSHIQLVDSVPMESTSLKCRE